MDTKVKTRHDCSNDPLLLASAVGHASLMVTGNLHDYTILNNKILYRPQLIVEQLYDAGYFVIRYSKSQGGRIHNYASLKPKEKQSIDSRLNGVGLLQMLRREGQNNPEELRTFFRGCSRLLQISAKEEKPIAVIIDYAEHLAPSVHTAAAATEEQIFVAETLHNLANSPALKKSKNLLICLLRDGMQNSLLNDLHRIEYAFPDEHQALNFIQSLFGKNNYAENKNAISLEKDFNENEFARITRGLRLRDIESMVREARAMNIPLSRNQVLEAKADAILRISEGTLALMSNDLRLDDIVGLEVVKIFFKLVAEKLKNGDPSSPRAVLMVGPPGTSKSTFAPILAKMCGFNIVEFQNIRDKFVGQSEKRLSLALNLVENLAPTILFIDEITEMIPSRNQSVTNDDISKDLLGQLLKFGSKDELRGKVLLLGASNVPERLDPAWLDRFIIVPFLELLPDEMCKLFEIFERRITGKTSIDSSDAKIKEACEMLHRKGASPRKVFDVVNHALLFSKDGQVKPDDIISAAHDYVGAANPMAVAYTSLSAVSLTSFYSYLPWSIDPENYIYPWYLEGVVDKKSGNINQEELYKRIEDYRKQANL